jgi:hypothetical protein
VKIFVNYRREDDPGHALALYGQLQIEFGQEQLFMDVEGGFKAGEDFVSGLHRKVVECDTLLAVIGPRWLALTGDEGRRRLDDPEDFVRVEIAAALKHGKRVIPILVNNASMPRGDDLPADLAALTRRQAARLTHEQFAADCHHLIRDLRESLLESEIACDERGKESQVSRKTHRATFKGNLAAFRGAFWTRLIELYPSESAYGVANQASSRWRPVGKTDLVVAQYISKRGVGVFIRGTRGADPVEIARRIAPFEDVLAGRLDAEFNNERYLFHKWIPCDAENKSNWQAMADWLKAETDRYDRVLREVMK